MSPLYEFLHHVVVAITSLRATFCAGVEIGYVGECLQLLVGTLHRTQRIEDVLQR